MIGSLYHPVYPPSIVNKPQKLKPNVLSDLDELDEDFMFNDIESDKVSSTSQKDDVGNSRPISTLKSLCEKVAAEHLVEPRNAVPLLEIADSLGAEDLRKHCEDIAIRNLDYILTVSAHAIATASLDILANLEKSLDVRSSEPWSYRRLPTPTATFPAIINSEEEDSESEQLQTRDNHRKKTISKKERDHRLDCFLQPNNDADEFICKQVRALRKKLQQIEMLEEKQSKGHALDDQQIAKLHTRSALENSLAELGVPIGTMQAKVSSVLLDGKGSKKGEVLKKQRRKSKQKGQVVVESADSGMGLELHPIKDFLDVQISQVKHKGKHHPSLYHNPKARTTGFAIATGQGSPSDSAGLNCWFKPEVDTPSSIRSIQIEERAIKDLKRFNSSVKILKNQS